MSSAETIEREAAQWYARQISPKWSAADQAALDAWLSASAEHKVALWRAEFAAKSVTSALSRPANQNARKRQLAVAASITAAVGLALWGGYGTIVAPGQGFETAIGAQKDIPLADGTKVELNTQTVLRAAVTPKRREVWLREGEAFFDVAHDPAHPFVIHAGKHTVTVLGTRFALKRRGDTLEVRVEEGRVRVENGLAHSPSQTQIATAGDIVRVDATTQVLARGEEARVQNDLSWRTGRLVFDRTPLRDAAAEFNRYNQRQLLITDPQTADILIGGSFEATNVEAFSLLLKQGFGLRVKTFEKKIEVSR